MKRFMLTVALTCTLSVSTLAGEMPTAGVAKPAPPQAVSTADEPGAEPSAEEVPGILEILILAIMSWP